MKAVVVQVEADFVVEEAGTVLVEVGKQRYCNNFLEFGYN